MNLEQKIDTPPKPFLVQVLGGVIVVCLCLMAVLVFGNVVLRYGFNSGIAISEEGSQFLFVWLTFLGAVLGMYEKAHLGMDSLVSRLSNRGRKICFFSAQLIALICLGVLTYGAFKLTIVNWDNEAPVSGMSYGWRYASLTGAAGVMWLMTLALLWRLIVGRIADDELIGIAESEEIVVVDSPRLHRR